MVKETFQHRIENDEYSGHVKDAVENGHDNFDEICTPPPIKKAMSTQMLNNTRPPVKFMSFILFITLLFTYY